MEIKCSRVFSVFLLCIIIVRTVNSGYIWVLDWHLLVPLHHDPMYESTRILSQLGTSPIINIKEIGKKCGNPS